MARTDNKILAMLGFSATGDLGPWTLYTSERHQIVFYPRVPALNPPSVLQLIMRSRFTLAAQTWQMLTAQQRADWEKATRKLSMKITGYNLWVYWSTTSDKATLHTIERQAGLDLIA